MAKHQVVKRGKTFEQRFLDELQRQCDGQDVAILNKTLRLQLGWQDETFDKVRAALINKELIKAAPGQGGKTRLVNILAEPKKIQALKVFVSYSHADENLKNNLVQHLKPLERLGLIQGWHDRMIKPGEEFGEVISNELEKSHIVLLLVSVDFINSKYCYEIELNRAIEMHQSGKSRVIPIILRNCLWHHSPFGGLNALPKDGEAVVSWKDRDEAFTSIAKAIHTVALDLIAK